MSGPLASALGIFGCLIASAFFSGSETALTSLGRARTTQLIDGAGGRSPLTLWAERPLEVLVTILIWNNVVNITASALATQLAEELLGGANADGFISPIAAAVGVMTLLLLTFGEITPKTFARVYAARLGPVMMRLLQVFWFFTRPVTLLFVRLTRVVSWASGREMSDGTSHVREEDIEFLVRLARRDGSLNHEREKLLRSVFDFTETTAREVMVPRTDVVFATADMALNDIVDRFINEGHSRLPVYADQVDNIVGLVYARDMLAFVQRHGRNAEFTISEWLREPKFVPETKPISQLLSEMQEERIHMAVVVDEFGGVAGIVTLEDIIEQFFGEILDEFDEEEPEVRTMDDGTVCVLGTVHLEDLADSLGFVAPESEDYDTLAGYISKVTGDIAHAGTKVDAWGWRFEVEEADERRIHRVRARRLTPPSLDALDDEAEQAAS